MSTQAGALAGVRVLDLSRVLAGPLCTQMLADHGAEVLKVEPPGGDETRGWGPPFMSPGTSAYFTGLNRNKRNVVLDLSSELGREAVRRLLTGADVLVENFRAGTLATWGFDDDYLAEHCPRLVHARITGFGADGPMGGAPGYDAVLQAYGGLMSVNGERDGDPLRVGVPVVDMVTGILAFSGILLALHERHSSGRGQLVDCSLLDAAVTLLHPHTATWFADRVVPPRTGSAHPTIAPYDTFPARDGLFFLAVGNDRQFRGLVELLGRPDLAEDSRFATNADRVTNRDDLRGILAPLLRAWDRDQLGRALLERGVPAGPVHDVAETMTDPQVLHRDLVVRLDGYTGVGLPVKLGRTPGSVRTPPRGPGADTVDVLRGLSFSEEQIELVVSGS
ncbi:MAG: CoA transferase [Actinomycetota bacterium]|jgi:crotonobetainyl-CoA:carnitine CoA-transferase CaiB-like acyl-CoA transferase|nr:CoA transferase [Actinomycetota bacterium]